MLVIHREVPTTSCKMLRCHQIVLSREATEIIELGICLRLAGCMVVSVMMLVQKLQFNKY